MKGRTAVEAGTVNWEEMAASSHYRTAEAVQQQLKKGNLGEAAVGLQELIQALGRSEKRELKSQLIRLMSHVIKWRTQPQRRSQAWAATICNAREEIADIQEEAPSLTDPVIRNMWERCFVAAKREAEGQMNRRSTLAGLSWKDVFEEPYEVK